MSWEPSANRSDVTRGSTTLPYAGEFLSGTPGFLEEETSGDGNFSNHSGRGREINPGPSGTAHLRGLELSVVDWVVEVELLIYLLGTNIGDFTDDLFIGFTHAGTSRRCGVQLDTAEYIVRGDTKPVNVGFQGREIRINIRHNGATDETNFRLTGQAEEAETITNDLGATGQSNYHVISDSTATGGDDSIAIGYLAYRFLEDSEI
jgi:hypothetical protein